MMRFVFSACLLAGPAFADPIVLEGLPPALQPRDPQTEQPAPTLVEERSPCEQTCDASVAACFTACVTAAEEADEASPGSFRDTLIPCQRPCSAAQATCRAACEAPR